MVVKDENHSIEIVGPNMDFDNYPLNAKRPSLEYLRDYLHLRPRTNLIPSMARIRNALAMATPIKQYNLLGKSERPVAKLSGLLSL